MKIHEFGFKTIEWIIECGDAKGIDRGCVECGYEQINGGVWSVVSGGEKHEDERVVWKVLGKQHEHH